MGFVTGTVPASANPLSFMVAGSDLNRRPLMGYEVSTRRDAAQRSPMTAVAWVSRQRPGSGHGLRSGRRICRMKTLNGRLG